MEREAVASAGRRREPRAATSGGPGAGLSSDLYLYLIPGFLEGTLKPYFNKGLNFLESWNQ
eukprot:4593939-Heterocapsa_arctica.AAC.1